jgi:hypothetical protein
MQTLVGPFTPSDFSEGVFFISEKARLPKGKKRYRYPLDMPGGKSDR